MREEGLGSGTDTSALGTANASILRSSTDIAQNLGELTTALRSLGAYPSGSVCVCACRTRVWLRSSLGTLALFLVYTQSMPYL